VLERVATVGEGSAGTETAVRQTGRSARKGGREVKTELVLGVKITV
jgi:hypothetical protein